MKSVILSVLLSSIASATISFCPPTGNGGVAEAVSDFPTAPGNGCSQVDQQYDNLNVVGATTGGFAAGPGPAGATLFGVGTNPLSNNVGIQWSGTVGATNNWSQSVSGNINGSVWSDTITFEVKTTDGSSIDGATLLFGVLSNMSNTNFAVTESICANQSTFSANCGGLGAPVTLTIGPTTTSNQTLHLSFAAAQDFAVQLVLTFTSNHNGSNSFALDTVTTEWDSLSVAPEPATFLLLGSALVGLGLLKRRKPKA